MNIKVITFIALVLSVATALTYGAIMINSENSITPLNEIDAEYEDSAQIKVMTAEERKQFAKMLADTDYLSSAGYSGSSDSAADHNIKYANATTPLPLDYNVAVYTIYKAQQAGIDPDLIFCMMWRESNFNPNAIGRNTNGTYDYGLLQINTSNLSYLSTKIGVKTMDDLLDPYTNIDACMVFMSAYVKKYNDYNKALMCYNLGERGAQKKWANGVESTSYSRSIIEKMGCYYVVEGQTMKTYPTTKYVAPATTTAESASAVSSEPSGADETTTAETTTAEKTTKKRASETVKHTSEYRKTFGQEATTSAGAAVTTTTTTAAAGE